jgi:hypothetical protein
MFSVDETIPLAYNPTFSMTRKGGDNVRRLHPPTLAQWSCEHRWRTTTTRPGHDEVVRVRYLTCRRCGLKVKTEERLAVPWDNGDFMTLVVQAFPENAVVDVVMLQEQGLPGEDLSSLDALLVPHGWRLDALRHQGRVVGVVRSRVSPEALGDTSAELDKGKSMRHGEGGD